MKSLITQILKCFISSSKRFQNKMFDTGKLKCLKYQIYNLAIHLLSIVNSNLNQLLMLTGGVRCKKLGIFISSMFAYLPGVTCQQ